MNKEDKELIHKFIAQSKAGVDAADLVDIKHIITKYKFKLFRQQVKIYEKDNKLFTYLITFTIDPKKHDVKDKSLHKKIEKYVRKFPINKSCEVVRADYVREGTDKDHKHTHWHLGLTTKKWFLSKTLDYYEKKYGYTDVTNSNDNNYKHIIKYINKSKPSKQIALL